MNKRINWLGYISLAIASSYLPMWPLTAQIIPDKTLGSENSLVKPLETIRGIPSNQIEGVLLEGRISFIVFKNLILRKDWGHILPIQLTLIIFLAE